MNNIPTPTPTPMATPAAPAAPMATPAAPEATPATPAIPAAPAAPEATPAAPEATPAAPAVTEIATTTGEKKERLTPTKKWMSIEPIWAELKRDQSRKEDTKLQQLLDLVKDFYQPKAGKGGGGYATDWTRRIEDSLGNVIAKRDSASGYWFRADDRNVKLSPFSKGKYVTKPMLKLLRDVEEAIQAEIVTLAMQGTVLSDKKKLELLSQDTGETEKFQIVKELYPTEFGQVVQDLATEGKYLGTSKEEANRVLMEEGYETKIGD